MKKEDVMLASALLVLLATGVILSFSWVPFVSAAENEQSGGMQATVETAVDLQIDNLPKWTNISKGATEQIADTDNGNPMRIIIKSTTTVRTYAQVKGSDNLEKTTGTYDYIGIDNVKMAEDQAKTNIFSLSTTYENISWLNDIAVPGASDNAQNVYMFLSTRSDQMAGTYTGTIYVKLVSQT